VLVVRHWCQEDGVRPADVADVVQEVFRAVARRVREFRLGPETGTFTG
jgi:hypothetical protein